MPELASYIFKPKHGTQLAMTVIERFCNDFLHWEHEGFYIHWRTAEQATKNGTQKYRPLPDGWVELNVETDSGSMEAWTESCYDERELEAGDMTDSFFAMLPQDFWDKDDEGKAEYNFYERELCEIVAALSDDDSRVISFGSGRSVWIRGAASEKNRYETVDLLDYALTVPIVKEKPQGEQLRLADWL